MYPRQARSLYLEVVLILPCRIAEIELKMMVEYVAPSFITQSGRFPMLVLDNVENLMGVTFLRKFEYDQLKGP